MQTSHELALIGLQRALTRELSGFLIVMTERVINEQVAKIFQPKYLYVLEESEFQPHPGAGNTASSFHRVEY